MSKFKGFTDSESFTQLPDTFFHQLLNQIDDAAELKVTLYVLWRVEHVDGPFRALRESDFNVKELGLSADEIHSGLEKAAKRGIILSSQNDADVFYFLNSPRGRATAEAFKQGHVSAEATSTPMERPNIFRLYEENIGPLTPLVADMLQDAEETYPLGWIHDAITIAVGNNVRRWRYVEAILRSWKEEGHDERKNRQNLSQDFDKYTTGKFADYIKK